MQTKTLRRSYKYLGIRILRDSTRVSVDVDDLLSHLKGCLHLSTKICNIENLASHFFS